MSIFNKIFKTKDVRIIQNKDEIIVLDKQTVLILIEILSLIKENYVSLWTSSHVKNIESIRDLILKNKDILIISDKRLEKLRIKNMKQFPWSDRLNIYIQGDSSEIKGTVRFDLIPHFSTITNWYADTKDDSFLKTVIEGKVVYNLNSLTETINKLEELLDLL